MVDPLQFAAELWPGVTFYKEQREIIYSVVENDQTFVTAGNMLGKDFVAGFLCLWYFLTHDEVRVVTTSVREEHLNVLWAEIDRFIRTSKYVLKSESGGELICNEHHIRRIVNGEVDEFSYIKGMVSGKTGEGMQGHHAKNTFVVIDEASATEDVVRTMVVGWAKKLFAFGNPHDCNNFWSRGIKEGDLKSETNNHYWRKVIKIKAADSPNVRLGEAQVAAGKIPTNKILIPGVITYNDYMMKRATLNEIEQCVTLDAEFYEGPGKFMFPPVWLNLAEQRAKELIGKPRKAKAIGVDPAEGGDSTSMAAVDELGLIELVSKKTPDTSVVTSEALAFMRKHQVSPEQVLFDAGGGGKQHVDRLRRQGYPVRAVAFGGGATAERRRGTTTLENRKEQDEVRYVYRNRRAEMYGILMLRLDPQGSYTRPKTCAPFGIPQEYDDLRQQLAPVPLEYDDEGRIFLPPKNKRDPNSTKKTLTEIIGRSPDDADALVLAVFGMEKRSVQSRVGSMI